MLKYAMSKSAVSEHAQAFAFAQFVPKNTTASKRSAFVRVSQSTHFDAPRYIYVNQDCLRAEL